MVSCRTGWWEPIVLTTYNPEGDELGRYTFTYNKSGSCYTENGEVKDATTNNWVKNYRTSYGYDPFGVRISAVTEVYDAPGNIWKPSKQLHYSYLDNGSMSTESCEV